MRNITDTGLALIRDFEGFSPIIYRDAAGLPTIGYGHLIRPDEKFPDGIGREWAEAILRQDVGNACAAVLRLINAPLTDGQFDALVSFTYNLGAGALQRSTLRRRANAEDHDAAAAEFGRWVWAGGRRLKGLVRRRAAEALRYGS